LARTTVLRRQPNLGVIYETEHLAMACVAALDQGNTIAEGLSVWEIREALQQAARDEAEAPGYTVQKVASWDEVFSSVHEDRVSIDA
jgi:hypothetical protein